MRRTAKWTLLAGALVALAAAALLLLFGPVLSYLIVAAVCVQTLVISVAVEILLPVSRGQSAERGPSTSNLRSSE